jgi:predicted dehydrogenase
MGKRDVRPALRLGIIGLGPWAGRYFSTCAGMTGHMEIVAASRRSDAPAPDFAAGVPIFKNWEDMFDMRLDGLIVAAHPSSHASILELCAARGMPVMLEKPMALDRDSLDRISRIRSAAPVLINHIHLFSPTFEEIRSMISQRDGDVRIISCGAGPGPVRDYSSLWDYGPHDVSMCVGLLGPEASLSWSECVASGDSRTYRMIIGSCGSEADVTVSNGSPEKIRILRVEFDGHVAIYDDRSSVKFRLDGSPVPVSQDPPLTRSVMSFLSAIRDGVRDWRFGTGIGVTVCRLLSRVEDNPRT